jgi:CheY-like chemotaxis protein
MQTNIARQDDYDQPRVAVNTLTTILIVDDDTTARLTISAMVSNEEYRVILGTGATEARERLPLIEPDVIICDFVMEGVSGDEFFRWLKADRRWRYIPIIAVTRLDNPRVRADLLNAGADAIAAKPINAAELRAMVYAAARTRRQYQNLMREAS